MSFVGGLVMTILVTNVVLDQFLGLCDATASGESPLSAALLALLLSVVTLIGTIVNWALTVVVLAPLGVAFLGPLLFVLTNLGIVTALSALVVRAVPGHAAILSDHLLRLGSNSLVLGVTIVATMEAATLSGAVGLALGGGIGFFLVTTLLSAVQRQLRIADIPEAFRGVPATFVTVGLIALAFLAFDMVLLQNMAG